jgi:tellurite resistance protein TerC
VIRKTIISTYRGAKRIVIIIMGGTVLFVGVLLIVLPGPAILVIPLGLAILGLEFSWARRWLQEIRNKASFRNNRRE